MSQKFRYIGQLFEQRPDAPKILQFIAPAEDLSTWGGIPQKSSRFMTGFQRAEDPKRKFLISEFLELKGNISPTSIVVAFRPDQVKITPLTLGIDADVLSQATVVGETVLIEIDYEDHTKASIEDLARMAFDVLAPNGAKFQVPSTDLEEEEEEEEDTDTINDDSIVGPIEDQLSVHDSQLSQFLVFLKDNSLLEKAKQEDEVKLRTMLINLLKPGTIVDGQHRTKGAAFLEKRIPFPVVALLDAEWKEQVFQFIIINQKARPIPSEFLTAIISSSLSPEDIGSLKKRLEESKIKISETVLMNFLNYNEKSPFASMIDFKVAGATGKLSYKGMLALARNFRGLNTHDARTTFRPFFEQVFGGACQGETYTEKRRSWNKSTWFEYFSAFWSAVYEKYADTGLWDYGSNLLKIVTLQELQNLFLQWAFDRTDQISEPDDVKTLAVAFLVNMKTVFFAKEWKLTSLQMDTGRKFLREALDNARKNPAYKYNDVLFKGVED